MPIRCQASILKPDGCEIPSKSSLVYLGSTLSASGDIISEVSRRLGMARADFTALGAILATLLIDFSQQIAGFQRMCGVDFFLPAHCLA